MLKAILGFLGGGVIKQFTDPLERAYAARLAAENDEQRLTAEQQIEFYRGQIELAAAATEHDKWWSPRTLMAYCATVVVFKLLIWDTVLGYGVTPDPGSIVNGILLTIIGFYFGSKAISDVAAKVLAAAVGRR